MAKFVDFVDTAAYAMNGAMKLGGAGIKGLDGIIRRLGTDTTDGFSLSLSPPPPPPPPRDMPFVADDPASRGSIGSRSMTCVCASAQSHPGSGSPAAEPSTFSR